MDIDLSPVTRIVNDLRSRIEQVFRDLEKIASRMSDTLGTFVRGLLPTALEAFAGALSAFKELVDGLLSNLAPLPDVGQEIKRALEASAHEWALGVLYALFPDLQEPTEAGPGDTLRPQSLPLVGTTIAVMVRAFLQSRAFTIIQRLFLGRGIPRPGFLLMFVVIGLAQLTAAILTGITEVAQQEGRQQLRPTLPQPEALAVAELRGLGDKEKLDEWWARLGYADDRKQLIIDTLRPVLTPEQAARSILSSSAIDPARILPGDVYQRIVDTLGRVGIAPDNVPSWLRLVLFSPPPSDLVRFLVRDVFDPSVVRDFELDDQFDQKFGDERARAFAQAFGMTEDVFRYYWRAHWELPSPTQVAEMRHRTTDHPIADPLGPKAEDAITLMDGSVVYPLLGAEGQDRLLATNDMLPLARKRFLQITYNPLTRVDVRRAYDLGVFGEPGSLQALARVQRAYIDLGYTPENARVLAEFTERLRSTREQTAHERSVRPTVNALVDAAEEGLIDDDELVAELNRLDVPSERRDALVAAVDHALAKMKGRALRQGIKRLYVAGHLSADDAVRELVAAGHTNEASRRLIDLWQPERRYREITAEERAQRDLSRTQVLEAYRDSIIAREEAAQLIRAMGYDERETDIVLALEDARQARAQRQLVERTVRTRYVNGRVDRQTAHDALMTAGIPEARISTLLDLWDAERDERTPDLTIGQVHDLATKGLWTFEQAAAELDRRGYTEEERDALIALWRHEVALEEEKLKLQRELAEKKLEQQRILEEAKRAQAAQLAAQKLEAAARAQERAFEQQSKLLEQRLASQERIAEQQRKLQETLTQQRGLLQERLAQARAEQQQRQIQARLQELERKIQAQQEALEKTLAARKETEERRIAAQQQLDQQRAAREQARAAQQVAAQAARDLQKFSQQLTTLSLRTQAQQAEAAARAQALQDVLAQIRQIIGTLTRSTMPTSGGRV